MDKKQYNDIIKSLDFIEQLCWLIDSKKNIKFADTSKQLRSLLDNSSVSKANPEEDMKLDLIGVLPSILRDETLFSTNASIVLFAEEVLNIVITRKDKRSRYELIGMIVCEADAGDSEKINKLMDNLSKIKNNIEQIKVLQKENGNHLFSWNETIRKLTGEDV